LRPPISCAATAHAHSQTAPKGAEIPGETVPEAARRGTNVEAARVRRPHHATTVAGGAVALPHAVGGVVLQQVGVCREVTRWLVDVHHPAAAGEAVAVTTAVICAPKYGGTGAVENTALEHGEHTHSSTSDASAQRVTMRPTRPKPLMATRTLPALRRLPSLAIALTAGKLGAGQHQVAATRAGGRCHCGGGFWYCQLVSSHRGRRPPAALLAAVSGGWLHRSGWWLVAGAPGYVVKMHRVHFLKALLISAVPIPSSQLIAIALSARIAVLAEKRNAVRAARRTALADWTELRSILRAVFVLTRWTLLARI
jgi:hypothetical protein